VKPVKSLHGDAGIPVRGGRTLPFVVTRSWSAPEGYYAEGWYLIDPSTREVLHEGARKTRLIWGLQGLTEIVDVVSEPLALEPGSYKIVFALGDRQGAELDVTAVEVGEEAA
jgi:hypothetical protein